jgi:hypothetical protein
MIWSYTFIWIYDHTNRCCNIIHEACISFFLSCWEKKKKCYYEQAPSFFPQFVVLSMSPMLHYLTSMVCGVVCNLHKWMSISIKFNFSRQLDLVAKNHACNIKLLHNCIIYIAPIHYNLKCLCANNTLKKIHISLCDI